MDFSRSDHMVSILSLFFLNDASITTVFVSTMPKMPAQLKNFGHPHLILVYPPCMFSTLTIPRLRSCRIKSRWWVSIPCSAALRVAL